MNLKDNFIILGADNSLRCTGWSIVKVSNYNSNMSIELLDYGYIDTKHLELDKALLRIEKVFNMVISEYKPDYISAEAAFAGRNAKTTMTLANIHGVMLLVAAKNNIPVRYYSVMTMKSQVLGGIKTKKADGTRKTGDEMKKEVSDKIIEIFGVDSFKKEYNDDVTDSISAVITFLKLNGEEVKPKPKKRKNKSK